MLVSWHFPVFLRGGGVRGWASVVLVDLVLFLMGKVKEIVQREGRKELHVEQSYFYWKAKVGERKGKENMK